MYNYLIIKTWNGFVTSESAVRLIGMFPSMCTMYFLLAVASDMPPPTTYFAMNIDGWKYEYKYFFISHHSNHAILQRTLEVLPVPSRHLSSLWSSWIIHEPSSQFATIVPSLCEVLFRIFHHIREENLLWWGTLSHGRLIYFSTCPVCKWKKY